ncbi:MAG: DUF192 domain-containing protein [Edaphobacter sp.]
MTNSVNRTSRLKILNLTRQAVLAHSVEVADRGSTRRKGLLGRDNLPAGEGLWIVPCESVHTFFMRFSIDLVYVDRTLKVRKVRSSVPPWRLSACLSAHSVIELAPGTIKKTQTRQGDQLEFSANDSGTPASKP